MTYEYFFYSRFRASSGGVGQVDGYCVLPFKIEDGESYVRFRNHVLEEMKKSDPKIESVSIVNFILLRECEE